MKNKEKAIVFSIATLMMLVLLSGCMRPPENNSNGGQKKVTIAGSTTVQPISTKAAEVYMNKNPDVQVSVQGGGSGTGVRMVTEETVEIGAASRDLKTEERENHPSLQVHVIAADGIAVAVHPSNSIDKLSMQEVQDIFSGKITNFKEIGGPDREIVTVVREEGSGTRATFEKLVMNDGELANDPDSLQKPSNGAVKATVEGNPNVIGYLGIGYLDKNVKSVKVDGVEPTNENVASGDYPISRNLHYITQGAPQGQAKKFIDFVKGSEGQKIVEEEGFVPIN